MQQSIAKLKIYEVNSITNKRKKKSQATATSQDDELLAGVETLDDATDAAERAKELSRQR